MTDVYNHIRTLLMNVSGTALVPEWTLGEEAVPRDYREAELPTYLDEVRARLFGVLPDRTMRNYRLAQFMTLLHATELAEFMTEADPRITYLRPIGTRRDLFDAAAFTPLAVTTGPEVTVVERAFPDGEGTWSDPDATGMTYHAYVATVDVDGADRTVTVTREMPGRRATADPVLLTPPAGSAQGKSTTVVPLIGSRYGMRVDYHGATDGSSVRVTFHERPTWDLGQIAAAMDVIGEPTLLQLFGVRPAEPYATFRNLFTRRKEVAYKLGGLLLAVAYRTDEVRLQRGAARG